MSVISILKRYGIRPSKAFSQNFLVALPTIQKLVGEMELGSDDVVLEIGAGLGVMTRLIAEEVKFVYAVEPDEKMVEVLNSELDELENVRILKEDILRLRLSRILPKDEKCVVVGNIPYHITSPILFYIRRNRDFFKKGMFVVQKEVARRLAAKPGSKDYGIVSVLMQSIADVSQRFFISRDSFYPRPDVDSEAIRMVFDPPPSFGITNDEIFVDIVRGAFGQRRKKIINAILGSRLIKAEREEIQGALSKAGLTGNERAEELDIFAFARLARAFEELS